jgi:hypothetical protein
MSLRIDKVVDGNIVFHNHPDTDITTFTTLDGRYVNVTGDTMTGDLVITPTANSATTLVVNQSTSANVLTVNTTGRSLQVTGASSLIADAAASIPLLVKAAGSQSADLQEWQGSGGAVLAGVDERGVLFSNAGRDVTDLFLGDGAGNTTMTGINNLGLGQDVLKLNTSGYWNVAIGNGAMDANTDGYANTALGFNSMTTNQTGDENTGLGFMTLNTLNGGNKNTCAGYQAGYSMTSGNENVAIGYRALFADLGGSDNVAIGMQALYANQAAHYNVAIGRYTLSGSNSGNANVAIGDQVLGSNTSGENNIAIGTGAMTYNTTGQYNIACGYRPLFQNKTSSYNVAFGNLTLSENLYGAHNLALGSESTRYNNIGIGNAAVGSLSLFSNTSGSYNLALGYGANYYATTGSYNVAIGNNALYYLVSGSYNVSLSPQAEYYTATGIGGASAVAGVGLSVGGYRYRVSFVLDTVETGLGDEKYVATAGSNCQVSLTSIPTYTGPKTCSARKIYRTVAGIVGHYYLVTTISDNTTTIYTDSKADITINGDASAQLTLPVLWYVDKNQSTNGVVYWNLTNSGTTRTIDIYKEVGKTTKIASGNRNGNGSITINPLANYGVSGSITVTYTGDDTDASNTFDLGTLPPDQNSSVMMCYGAKAFGPNQFVIGSSTSYITDLYLGEGVYGSNPHTVTINATGGSGTNNAAASLTLAGGQGSGSGTGGDIIFKTALPGASGTAANALVERMRIDDDGNVTLGGFSTNYTKWDVTGHQTMVGTAQPWDDLRIEPTARTTGSNSPTFEKWYDDAGGTSRGVYLYSFDDAVGGSEKEVFFNMQLPHSWNQDDIAIHVHWVGAVADTTSAPRWGLEYAWAEHGATYGDSTIVYSDGSNYTEAGTDANITQHKHYISKFTALSPTTSQDGVSSVLIGRLFRDSANAGDTYNAEGAKCGLLYIDAHYQLARLGSTDEYTV